MELTPGEDPKVRRGEPIVGQSPTVEAGGRVVVILPGPVATVRVRRRRRGKR